MTETKELKQKIARLEKQIVRERHARREAEFLLEKKSGEIYALNEKLNEDVRLLESVVLNARDGVIITNTNWRKNGPEIIYANEAFAHISGYAIDQLKGRGLFFLKGCEADKSKVNSIIVSLKKGKTSHITLENYRKDMTAFWLDMSIVPVKDSQNVVTHFSVIARDVTEQRAIQQEIETANITKSEFLNNINHELRTPMHAIISMCNFLLESDLSKEQRQNTEILHTSSNHLLGILNSILDISKIEAREIEIESTPFYASTVIHEVTDFFLYKAQEKNLALRLDLDDSLSTMVTSDPAKIALILRKLIDNAIKFTRKGEIFVSAKIQHHNKQKFLTIAIRDTGIGIPENQLSEIFEKFTQADMSVTRTFGGTGLGLTIAQQIITLMKGKLKVESVEGKGSKFFFYVPVDDVVSQPDSPHKKRKKHNGTDEHPWEHLKVLTVDDHFLNQRITQKFLNRIGVFDIQMAENGRQALDMIRNRDYDIVLMDCQMPEMDGYQATRELRKIEKDTDRHVPVIALSANATSENWQKCLDAGMDNYLAKPIKPDRLEKLIKRYSPT